MESLSAVSGMLDRALTRGTAAAPAIQARLATRWERAQSGLHGDLPDAWEDDLSHEITPALGISLPAADKLASNAWELRTRLPGIGAALADGTIDYLKG